VLDGSVVQYKRPNANTLNLKICYKCTHAKMLLRSTLYRGGTFLTEHTSRACEICTSCLHKVQKMRS
jgi:hypothetical protein